MNIADILTDAFKLSLRHRKPWLLIGLPLAATGLTVLPGVATIAAAANVTGNFESLSRATGAGTAIALAGACLTLGGYAAIFLSVLAMQGALIITVDRILAGEKTSLRLALRSGLAKMPALGLSGAVLFSPVIAVGVVMLGAVFVAGNSPLRDEGGALAGALLCVLLPLYCGLVLYTIAASAVFVYSEREILLNGAGPITALRRGWRTLRLNLGNTVVLGLIVYVVNAVTGTVLAIGMQLGLLPLLLLAPSFNPDRAGDYLSAGGLAAALTLVFFACFAFATTVYAAWYITFNAAVWTLAFRNAKQSPAVPPAATAEPQA